MPTIPTYNREVSLDPQFTAMNTARATPEAFGAAVGRGMQDVGQGIDMIAKAKFTLQQKLMENDKRAAQIRTEAEANRILFDADNGIMNRTGTNAVGAGKAFEAEVEKLRVEGGKGLQGQALIDYNLYIDQMIVDRSATVLRHESTEVKKAVDQSYVSLADTYAENAATYSSDPSASRKYIDEGVKVLMERAVTFGINDATRDNDIVEYVRNAHKTVAMTIATTDPLAAQAYLDGNREELGAGFYEALTGELKPAVTLKQADDAAAGFFASASDAVASDGTEPDDDLATPDAEQASPTRLPLVPGKNAISVTNLDGDFVSSMERMIAAMPEELRGQVTIYSGWRPATRAEAPAGYVGETQDEIFAKAVAKYGSEAAARKHAAPPGKSNHNHGQAADLKYGSDAARQWIHDNAADYGLTFPMGHEPWHIEPVSARGGGGAPAGGAPAGSAPAGGTSSGYMDPGAIEAYVAALPEDVRAVARDSIYARYDAVAKADTYNRRVANDQIFAHILQNDTMPTDPALLNAAGMENVLAARRYLESGPPVETDEATYRRLLDMKIDNPRTFIGVDMNVHRSTLSEEDFKTMLADQREMIEGGKAQLDYGFARAEVEKFVAAQFGPAPDASKIQERKEYNQRLQALYRNVEADMKQFQKASKVAPTNDDILRLVMARTLPTVRDVDNYGPFNSKEQSMSYELRSLDPERQGFELDADAVVMRIERPVYDMIVADLTRREIELSPQNIALRYQQFLLWGTSETTSEPRRNEFGGGR